jgi:hypothetical protein
MIIERFLDDFDGRSLPWSKPPGAPSSFDTDRILFGNGDNALEVAVAIATNPGQPRIEDLRGLFRKRHANRPAPVLLVVGYTDASGAGRAAVVGTSGDPAPATGLSLARVARICAAGLAEPDRHAAARTLDRLLTGLKDQLSPGLVNSGLFASHELRTGVPARNDWPAARSEATPLLGLRGLPLIQALGYDTAPRGSVAVLLTQSGTSRAIAVLLDETEVFDRAAARFGAVSPVAHGLAVAAREGLPWLVVIRGTQIRLCPARPDVGVGRKGQAETYTELDLALLGEDEAAYLTLLFAPSALAPGGTAEQILSASENFAADLGARLRERIYDDVVPGLALAVAARLNPKTDPELTEVYHLTLLVLFRLLFLAYAEDRGLLPYGRNPRYDRHAIKTLAKDFAATTDLTFDGQATSLWDDLTTVWAAVDEGNSGWDVPAYNGGLFSRDPATNPSGATLDGIALTDAELGPALLALLIDVDSGDTPGPVDFRSLSVREFGTIYEGLLEADLSIADTALTLDNNRNYVPAQPGDEVVVAAGAVYVHNQDGQRKSTGSYFTKQFAVEHLLNGALEPAIDEHLQRVAQLLADGDDAAAAEAFFDFRVADLAMGSAHFLVSAIDRIEAKFTAFLTEHPLPAVTDELTRLVSAARTALGTQADTVELETGALLRRQVARRCIYGLDLNLMAVELARLAIWIHTFIPGLPMSSLDHSLACGNSLTGIGTLDEVLDVLDPSLRPGQISLFTDQIESALATARDRLVRAARTAEATKAEVREAAAAHAKAMEEARDARALLDAAVAVRLGVINLPAGPAEAIAAGMTAAVQDALRELRVAHLPYLFPEVFLRTRAGFDVILGNPPWEKVRWEAAPFWVGVHPGLMALRDAAREEKITELRRAHPVEAVQEQRQQALRAVQQGLFKAAYTLRGGTHLELAQLMLERAIRVRAPHGRLGLVLPRQSMVLAGWKNLRKALVTGYDLDIVQGRNDAEWIFDDVEPRYSIVLLAAAPAVKTTVRVGVARSPADIAAMSEATGVRFTPDELADLSDANVIPWFNAPSDRRVFDLIRPHPRLASGGGWIQARYDSRWDFTGSGGDRALPVRTDAPGAWHVLMTAAVDQFAFDPTATVKQFITDLRGLVARGRGIAIRDGHFVVTDEHPVILIRRPSRSNDSRTLIAAALPESGMLPNNGSVHGVMHAEGTGKQERLALLALLNTATADWWARRFVDRHVTSPVINNLRLPNWTSQDIAHAAEIAATLLARHGATTLAGGITAADTRPEPEVVLRAELERLTLHGYGLQNSDFAVIASDFTTNGISAELRAALGVREDPS